MILWMAGYANHSIIGAKDVSPMPKILAKWTISLARGLEVDPQVADLMGLG
jgi:hypothetical protein